MKLYIKNAYVRGMPGFEVYNEHEERIYSVPVGHSVLGIKMDLYNFDLKRISKIRQHGFTFNKTYNIHFDNKKTKLIFKIEENKITALIKGYPFSFCGDIVKKDFSILNEKKNLVMSQVCKFNYYELNIIEEQFDILCICIALCIDTLLLIDEKNMKENNVFLIKDIFEEKKILGGLKETFSNETFNKIKF